MVAPFRHMCLKLNLSAQKSPVGLLSPAVNSSLQLPFVWRRNGREVGFPDYIIGCEEDGKYFCNVVNATTDDAVSSGWLGRLVVLFFFPLWFLKTHHPQFARFSRRSNAKSWYQKMPN